MPRVITGKYKGTILNAPKGDATRPTTDKVKESLFSIIQTEIPGARVLDLFSGTGQIAIESVSRGAESAVMVDRSGAAASVIRSNLQKIHAESDPSLRLIKAPVNKAIEKLAEEGAKFDIIFMDPPYKMAPDAAREIADQVKRLELLADEGIMIVEHSSEIPLNTDVINMQFKRSCTYGLTVLAFFKDEISQGG